MKSEGNSQDFLAVPPVQIEDAITQQQPQTYLMSHLLATGFRGTEYQLSVLLWRLIILLGNHHDFEAVTEIEGYGNLDDIGLVIKDKEGQILQVETYQVKYYNYPIKIQDFFKSSEEQANIGKEIKKKSKTEKMHIGKFFAGWLSWRAKYPHLSKEKIQSIIFTNTTLNEQLLQCISNNQFTPEFISHENKIIVERKITQVGKVCKNFLFKKNDKISREISKKIWDFLLKNGFIDKDGCFTEKYTPKEPGFSLKISKEALQNKRFELTEAYIIEQLTPLYEHYVANQIDLFTVLKGEAWAYLAKKKLHTNICELQELDKDKWFREFLQSVRFQVDQHPIEQLETNIQESLRQIQKKPVDQLYLCLYYAIRAWFRKEEPYNQRTILTAELTKALIHQAEIRSNKIILLQGRTEEVLSNICYFSLGKCIVPSASYLLKKLLHQSGVIVVSGNKGIGKSGMVKLVLEQSCHPSQYLFFSAANLLSDDTLKESLSEVIKFVAGIEVLVIDNAELFFSLDASVLEYYIDLVNKFSRTLVLNIASEMLNPQRLSFKYHVVKVEPLAARDVIHYFSQLAPYQTLHPLIELACRPFYLNTILKISAQISTKELDEIKKLTDVALQAKLVKIALKGTDAALMKDRKLVMRQLASAIISSENKLNREASLPRTITSLDILQKDGFITYQNNKYSFSHDLFFEYALMLVWQLDWEHAHQKDKTAKFWEKFKKNMVSQDRVFIFEKWVALYAQQIIPNLIEHWELIKSHGYHQQVIAMAFATNNDELFNYLLEKEIILLDGLLNNIRGYDCATAVLLTIKLDYPSGLRLLLDKGARPHHPQASQSEIKGKDLYDSKSATDSTNSNSSDSDDNATDSGYDYSNNSDHDYSFVDDCQYEDSESDEIIQSFVRCPEKYWSSGFYEEPFHSYDEGDIENKAYQSRPQNDLLYLHQAAIYNRVKCLNILLQEYKTHNQQHVNLRNEYDETALHLAVLEGADAAIEALLYEGANINSVDYWKETVLHNAVYAGHIEAARLLLKQKVNVNAQNKYGITALHIALVTLNLDMVKLLFSYGADISMHAFEAQVEATNLLKRVLDRKREVEECLLQDHKGEVEEFVWQLVKLLNYGNNKGFEWGTECEKPNLKRRQAQLDKVKDLMGLVKHHTQISIWHPGFDYTEEEENEYNSNASSANEDDSEEQITEPEENLAPVTPPFAKCITQNSPVRTDRRNYRNGFFPEQPKKDTHWYTTDEINQLIQLVAQEHNDVGIITPLLGTNNHYGINELSDTLKEWQNARHINLSTAPQASKILVPVNVDKAHWVLLYFILPTDSAMLSEAYYFDPYGGNVPKNITSAVANITTVVIRNLQASLQRDKYNCGPWVIAAAASLINNNRLPNLDFDIEEARRIQQQALNPPNLDHEKIKN